MRGPQEAVLPHGGTRRERVRARADGGGPLAAGPADVGHDCGSEVHEAGGVAAARAAGPRRGAAAGVRDGPKGGGGAAAAEASKVPLECLSAVQRASQVHSGRVRANSAPGRRGRPSCVEGSHTYETPAASISTYIYIYINIKCRNI